VENALRWKYDSEEPGKQNELENTFPAGVQYWIMDDAAYAVKKGYSIDGAGILTGTEQLLSTTNGETKYNKQVFRKEFSVLGDDDDLKGIGKVGYKNFTYNGERENEIKVFVLCAIDNMQKVVYRTIRFLPKRLRNGI